MVRKVFNGFLISVILTYVVVCTPSLGKASSVKLGIYLPMSGSSSVYGKAVYRGIEVAHTMRATVLNRKVELILADTTSDKMKAANAVEKLITTDHVRAIIGGATTNGTLAGAAIADRAKIPMVSPTTTNPSITQDKMYIFRVCFIDTFQGKAAAAYAYETLGARKAAVMIDIAQDYSIDLANVFEREFMDKGGKIVSHTYCQTSDQDFTMQLQAIMAAKPDVLYLPNYFREVARVCRQAKKLGLNVSIISADGVQTEELLDLGGNDVEGLIFTGHFDKSLAATPMAKRYLNYFMEETGKEAGPYEVLGADAYFVILDAIERAQSFRSVKIRNALARTKGFKGVSGVITIGSNGNAIKSLVFMQIKEGAFRHLKTVNPKNR